MRPEGEDVIARRLEVARKLVVRIGERWGIDLGHAESTDDLVHIIRAALLVHGLFGGDDDVEKRWLRGESVPELDGKPPIDALQSGQFQLFLELVEWRCGL